MVRKAKTLEGKAAQNRSEFRSVAQRVQPSRFLEYRHYLLEVYQELKAHYRSYSYVEYSIDLGFGRCNAMHLITHGVRPLTLKGARKIVEAIGLTGVERQYFLKLLEYAGGAADGAARESAFEKLLELKARSLPTELDRKQLEFYADWYNAAVLEILGAPEASDAPEWIAARLHPRVAPSKVQRSLELLKELGYVVHDEAKGRLVPAQELVTTGPEVFGMAVTSFHQQMIELAKESIAAVEPEQRDVSGLTLGVSAEVKERLKGEIIAFRKRVLDIVAESKAADEIVQLNVQMFPVARGLGKGGGSQ